jgi:pyruvate-formate lyase
VLKQSERVPSRSIPLSERVLIGLDAVQQNRGQMLALMVNDCDKLRAVQIEPEKYRDLQIRIGGWNVYFTDLAPVMQES